MNLNSTLEIFDEDGFIAIVDTNLYHTFVHEDWELDQLFEHFVNEMNKDSIIVWSTNPGGGLWKVKFLNIPSTNKAYRQFDKNIKVTNGKLFLTDYTDLTMVAQFADEQIPSIHNSNLFIPLDNGRYSVTVRQMFDPNDFDYQSSDYAFEIIIKQTSNESDKVGNVFWWAN